MRDSGRILVWAVCVSLALLWGGRADVFAQGATVGSALATYTWRYERQTVDGAEMVKRVKMTWEEGEAWDTQKKEEIKQQAQQGELYGVPAGADIDAVATWRLYYDQLVLWDEYLKQTALAEVEPASSVESIQWGAEPTGQGGAAAFAGGPGAEALVAANQGMSLDQQTGQFFALGGAPGQQGGVIVTRDNILQQVISLYDIYVREGKKADEVTYKKSQDVTTGLTEREGRRLAYRNWLDDHKIMVMETALDWGKRQQGQVVIVNGIQYELYSASQGLPQGQGPADVVRVVTENLTPYDLLNADGTQRRPVEQ